MKTRVINQSVEEFAHEKKGRVSSGGEISVGGTFSLIQPRKETNLEGEAGDLKERECLCLAKTPPPLSYSLSWETPALQLPEFSTELRGRKSQRKACYFQAQLYPTSGQGPHSLRHPAQCPETTVSSPCPLLPRCPHPTLPTPLRGLFIRVPSV